jgi:flagellar basal body rod protein FlgB
LAAARAGKHACMSSDQEHDVDAAAKPMEDEAAMLQEQAEHLGDDIEESRRKLEQMRSTIGDDGNNVAGDWEDTNDASGGEDPKGA